VRRGHVPARLPRAGALPRRHADVARATAARDAVVQHLPDALAGADRAMAGPEPGESRRHDRHGLQRLDAAAGPGGLHAPGVSETSWGQAELLDAGRFE